MSDRLSGKAETDILSNFLAGIEPFGVNQAERYHKQFARCFDFLADHPRVARERDEIAPPVRIHPFEAHLALSVKVVVT